MSGALVLVAGPSGAGKDTLLRLAQEKLRDEPRFVFVRRVITRPKEAVGEDHEPAEPREFARRVESGAFALSWEAHGLRYGVPRAIEDDLAAGRVVVVNVSRAVIPEAVRRYPGAGVVIVTAPLELLAARLAERGREPAAEHRARLARPDLAPDATLRPHCISNDRTPEVGAQALVAILRSYLPQAHPSPDAASTARAERAKTETPA
jgi:phosphonate metabolism protein PhnN/1,5-bisphosphokinase (PRPP-forming)